MLILFCMLFLPTSSAIMGLLGFWAGRCARKLPIIDDNLPWTLSRYQVSESTEEPPKAGPSPVRWPEGVLRRNAHRQTFSHSPEIARASTD